MFVDRKQNTPEKQLSGRKVRNGHVIVLHILEILHDRNEPKEIMLSTSLNMAGDN